MSISVADTHQLYKEIFARRLELALNRQPDHDPKGAARNLTKLARLCGHLDSLKKSANPVENAKYDTPYELSEADWNSFREVDEFGQGGQGRRAAFETSSKTHLFRITSTGSLLSNTTITWRKRDFPMETPAELYTTICNQTQNGTKWKSLLEFGDGDFTGPCQFSWWTDFEVDQSDVIHAALRLGLTEMATGPTTVLLRIPLDSVLTRDTSIVRVPNSLDAFTNKIFLPIACAQSPAPPVSGITIPLVNFPTLNPDEDGEREYAVRPIPVDDIEIIPVLNSLKDRNRSGRTPVRETPGLLSLLVAYYVALP